MEAVHARRELLLLRLLELALLLPARRSPRSSTSRSRGRSTASAPRARRRLLLGIDVVFNLSILAYFKYADFFIRSSRDILDEFGIHAGQHLLNVALPVGISFFTFQALSYVIDVYRRDFEPGSLINFATYLSFFPHVVAGPIVRGSEFMPQIDEPKDPRRIDASRAFFLIFIGLFKKVVIANYLATEIVDRVFASPGRHSSLELLVGVYGYAVQIYADFSGYTDMAIGLALLLGFRFPLNFDSPYTATSLQDFWRRWHMTLSRWLRDYLYIPLGGNRGGDGKTYRNLMLTFVLGGLWHGAAWTFVIWGAIHGGVLSFEHWRRSVRTRRGLPDLPDTLGRRVGRRIITFNIVCVAWVFFRAESLGRAVRLPARPDRPVELGRRRTAGVVRRAARDRDRHRRPVRAEGLHRPPHGRLLATLPRRDGRDPRRSRCSSPTPSARAAWPRSSTSGSDVATQTPPRPPDDPSRDDTDPHGIPAVDDRDGRADADDAHAAPRARSATDGRRQRRSSCCSSPRSSARC